MPEIGIAGRETPDGLVLVTRGLAAGGLPELRVTGLPPYLGHGWARLLAVLAQRLAQRPADPPEEIILTPYDLVAILGGDPAGTAEVRVRLVTVDGHLEPRPPEGFEGEAGDWHREAVLKLLPPASS